MRHFFLNPGTFQDSLKIIYDLYFRIVPDTQGTEYNVHFFCVCVLSLLSGGYNLWPCLEHSEGLLFIFYFGGICMHNAFPIHIIKSFLIQLN